MALSDEVYELEQKYKELRDEVEEADKNAEYHENIADDLRAENADLVAENDRLQDQLTSITKAYNSHQAGDA
jgi:regulator of replication initiation timing